MFFLRSAFWLTVAFFLIRPDVDLHAAASNLSGQAMVQGQQFIAQQIAATECTTIECAGGKAVLTAVLPQLPQAGHPMHDSPVADVVPLPRPRPHRAG